MKIKDQKVGHHPPPTTQQRNLGVGNDILINWKRSKWTPSPTALHLLPGIFKMKYYQQ